MKRILMGILIILPLANLATIQGQTSQLSILSWLEGTWEYESINNVTTEKWTMPSPKTLEGYASVRKKGTSAAQFSEELRMISMKGEVFYLAKVDENEMPIPFKLVSNDSGAFVFENMKHDFPQRITYFKHNKDSMSVRVEGLTEPNIRYFELYYSRSD